MIDLTKILNEGDTIFCSFVGLNCKIVQMFNDAIYPIYIQACEQNSNFATVVTKEGKFANRENAECVIWPDKNTRTWENYQKYNLGDIVYLCNSNSVAVIKEKDPTGYYRSFFVYRLNSKTFLTNQLIEPSRKATKEEIEEMRDEMDKQGIYFDYVTCKFEKLLNPEDSTFVDVVNPKNVYWFIIPKDLDHRQMLMNKLKSLSEVVIKTIDFKDKPSCVGHIAFNCCNKIYTLDFDSDVAKVIMMFGKELKINS